MPPGIEEITKWGPPYLALYLLIWAIWKAGRWAARRFFDDDDGLVTGWFTSQQALFREQSEATKAIAQSINQTNAAVEAVQRRIDRVTHQALSPQDRDHLMDIILDDSPVPMTFVAEAGGFLRTNEPFEDLLGYTKQELAEMSWQDVTPNHHDIQADAALCESIAMGHSTGERIEKTYRRKDGSQIYCACHIRRFPRSGPFRHYVSIIIPLQPDRQIR